MVAEVEREEDKVVGTNDLEMQSVRASADVEYPITHANG